MGHGAQTPSLPPSGHSQGPGRNSGVIIFPRKPYHTGPGFGVSLPMKTIMQSVGFFKSLCYRIVAPAQAVRRQWAQHAESLLPPTLVCLMALIFFLCHRHVALLDSGLLYPWDVSWYRSLVENGYVFDGDLFKNQNVAFMPLYPLLTHLIKKVFYIRETYQAMLITSSLLTYVATVYLYRLLALLHSTGIALASTLCFLFFPYSFYLFNGYAEPCFMACAMLFFYCLTKGSYRSAALIASASFLAKQIGVILMGVHVCTLTFHVFSHYKRDPKEAKRYGLLLLETFPLLFLGIGLFTFYFYLRFSDPMLFNNILISWTQTVTPAAVDLTAIIQSTRNIFYSLILSLLFINDPVGLAYIMALISFFTILFCVFARKLTNISVISYSVLMLLFNIAFRRNSMNPDLGRYMLMNVPFFISIPLLIDLIFKECSKWYWLALGLVLCFFMAYYGHHVHLFYHGKWVS